MWVSTSPPNLLCVGQALAGGLRYLDRVEDLGEQLMDLEERLGSCKCPPLPSHSMKGPDTAPGPSTASQEPPQGSCQPPGASEIPMIPRGSL